MSAAQKKAALGINPFQIGLRNASLLMALLVGLALMIPCHLAAQIFTTLHTFTALNNNTNSDGANPQCSLLLLGDTLYGTAYNGGPSGYGTVFSVKTNGSDYRLLYGFANQDGAWPDAGLLLLTNNLCGTTFGGGPSVGGIVFTIDTSGTTFNMLTFFTGNNGDFVTGPLVLAGPTFYGSTSTTIFALSTDGSNLNTLYTFTALGTNDTNADGNGTSNLILSSNKLYGTTRFGGTNGAGTIFAFTPDSAAFSVLYTFGSMTSNGTNVDGSAPYAGLLASGNSLYGTASHRGIWGHGIVFKINTDGSGFTVIHNFARSSADGADPSAPLIVSGNRLYGTTAIGGNSDQGTIFALDTNGSEFATLHSFSSLINYTNSDGAFPQAGLLLVGNTIYGTTSYGGLGGSGTVFKLVLQPQLSIRLAGSKVILSWPTNFTGFTLQSTTSLALPAWTTVLPAPVTVNGQNTVTNSIAATGALYRLAQ